MAVEGKEGEWGVPSASTQQALREGGHLMNRVELLGEGLSERALERNETALAEAESQKLYVQER